MDKNANEMEGLRRLADCVHESAELASALYEQDRLYRREDLRQVLDAKRLESARVIAEMFLKAAQQRNRQHLRALLDALFDAWEARRKRRPLALRGGAALGISGTELLRRQQRMGELVSFLAMEILAVAFILTLSKCGGGDDGGDDGGGTAAYLVMTLPELRPPCPIQEDIGDDEEQEYDREGQL